MANTIQKDYQLNDEPNFIIENGFYYVLTAKSREMVREDGLSFGYSIDFGAASICTFTQVSDDENQELIELQKIIDAHSESRKRCIPRYLKYFDFNLNDLESEECQDYILGGDFTLLHKFHWDGMKVYKAFDDVSTRYFISVDDEGSTGYACIYSHDDSDVETCIRNAITDDVARDAKKIAKKSLKRKVLEIQKRIKG